MFKPNGSRTTRYIATTIEGTTKEDAIKLLMGSPSHIEEVLWPKGSGESGYCSLLRSEI